MQNNNILLMIIIYNWHYEDGWREIPPILQSLYDDKEREFTEELVGWHCLVHTNDGHQFEKWMNENMSGQFDIIYRFNSGDPMWFVHIKNDNDASLFKLQWI